MLIRHWDKPIDDDEWREFVRANAFGHLVAAGRDRDVPVVVPTQFVLVDEETVVLHLARPNPIWRALEENPTVLLSVAGDWAYIPSSWKTTGDEDPRRGIPTTYYAAVQLIGRAEALTEPADVAGILRTQLADLQPDLEVIDPVDHGGHLHAIRGLHIEIAEVRAKFKYGANVDVDHRAAVLHHLVDRDGPGDRAAAAHLTRRLPLPVLDDEGD